MAEWFCNHNTVFLEHRFAPAQRLGINIYLNKAIKKSGGVEKKSLSIYTKVEQSTPTPKRVFCNAEATPQLWLAERGAGPGSDLPAFRGV